MPHSTVAMSLFHVMIGVALTCGAIAIRRHSPRPLLLRLVRSLAGGITTSTARRPCRASAHPAVRITITGGDAAEKRRRGDQLRTALAELAHERGAAPVPNTAIRIDMALARNGIPYLAYLERDVEANLSVARIASILDDVPIHVDQQHTNLANIYRELTRFDPGITFVGLPAEGGEPVREGLGVARATGATAANAPSDAMPAPRVDGRRRQRDIPLEWLPAGPDDIDVPLSLDGAGDSASARTVSPSLG